MITLIHPSIDPVIVSFYGISIRWYGMAYVVGLFLGLIIIKKLNIKSVNPIKNKLIDDFFIWCALGVIIGGRVGYLLFYQTTSLYNQPISIFYIWQGGMSFHGGLVGVIISMYIFAKKKKTNFFLLSDFVSTVAPIGIFFGRLANFINVELYGRVTSFPFAMKFLIIDEQRRHPSQLYEAFFEGIIIFIILISISKKTILKNRIGLNTSYFLIIYGVFRFFLEFLREPDSHIGLILNYFTVGQLLSIPMVIIGFIILSRISTNGQHKK